MGYNFHSGALMRTFQQFCFTKITYLLFILATFLLSCTIAGAQVTLQSQASIGTLFGGNPQGVAVDGAGNVYIAVPSCNCVYMVAPGGGQSTVGTGLSIPYGVAVDGIGNVFIADTGNSRVV